MDGASTHLIIDTNGYFAKYWTPTGTGPGHRAPECPGPPRPGTI